MHRLGLVTCAGTLLAVLGCTIEPASRADSVALGLPPIPPVAVHTVYVQADGSFSPQTTYVEDGQLVRFVMHDRRDAVIPSLASSYPAICDAPMPWEENAPNRILGPMPVAPSGIFTLGPNPGDPGIVSITSATDPCGGAAVRGHIGDQWLCASGEPTASMDETWADEDLDGVFIRLRWSDVNPEPGVYDFSELVREVEKAVANGKLYSIGVEAGRTGTPDWIFDTDRAFFPWGGQLIPIEIPRADGGGGVNRLRFQDHGSQATGTCGAEMDLGSPADPNYQDHYLAMLWEIAATLQSNAAWYRALAYVKPSGANLFTAENRLPKNCEPGCYCNTRIWSEAGYRPSGLYEFYENQTLYISWAFPGKTMSYALIKAGFPKVDEGGGYVDEAGVYIDGNGPVAAPNAEIGGLVQTQEVLDLGQASHGTLFAVQHNGLHPKPNVDCTANPGNAGCPARMVVDEGAEGQYTGFQTQNLAAIDDNALLESAFENAWDNSSATFLEIYEERAWEARIEGLLDPAMPATSRTVGDWATDFHRRRSGITDPAVDPPPPTFMVRFDAGSQEETYHFFHASKCADSPGAWGKIVVQP